jgi:serine/threonine protein kinase
MKLETICVSCMEDDSGSPICPKCGAPFNLPVNNLLLLPPRTILREQYLIGRALGHGGFGITYLAWDIGLETRLAVKEYMPAGVAGRTDRTKAMPLSDTAREEYEWGLERFLEEARVLKKSNHPNIVSVDTVFRDNGTAYLVMEYLEGVTFAEFLRRRGGTIPFADALQVMLPVMDALTAVHALNIVHRDVSPENIFIPKMGKVKLIDFGAARNALSHKSRNLSAILKGGYAPEEQYRASGKQGPWTDVYAAAATLYRAIAGQVPVPSLDRQAEDTLERPSQLGVAIPSSAEDALMQAMAVRADQRFQSMEEFKRALTGGISVPRAASIAVPGEARPPQTVPQESNLEAKIRKYESSTSGSGAAAVAVMAPIAKDPVGKTPAVSRSSSKWLAPVILAGILVLAAGAGGVWWLKHRIHSGPTGPFAEWPAQPNGIPQPDLERQRQLEAQGQPAPAPAAPPQPAAPETAQPTPVQPPQPRLQTSRPPPPQPQPTARVAAESTPAPIVPPPAPPAPSYSDMVKQAGGMIGNKQYAEAQALLNQAIAANPGGSQAYDAIAKVELYYLNQPAKAFEHYRAAVANGGVASLHVLCEHNDGWLSISRGNAAFKAKNAAIGFDTAAVIEAKKNKSDKIKFGKAARQTFHIRLANGRNYNFEPGSQDAGQEVDFILSIIGP